MTKIRIDDLPVFEELDEKQALGIFGGSSFSNSNIKLTDSLLQNECQDESLDTNDSQIDDF